MVGDLRTLSGRNVLIVEDEYFIATDLQRALAAAGATVVGPAGNVADGLKLAQSQTIHAAILDVNLDGDRSYALADELRRTQIPYMFLTGYDGWSLAPEHRDAPRLAKPFSDTAVIEMLTQICDL